MWGRFKEMLSQQRKDIDRNHAESLAAVVVVKTELREHKDDCQERREANAVLNSEVRIMAKKIDKLDTTGDWLCECMIGLYAKDGNAPPPRQK